MEYSSRQRDKHYLLQLLHTAKTYNCNSGNTDRFYDVIFFYRNKSEEYFEEAKKNGNILKKKRKDNNGDPKSPINGKLAGVFFSVALFQGTFPTSSPFGDTRVHIPIEAIFEDSTNLYFTDFYCSTSETHYATLVLTPGGSKEDVFCQTNLLKLNPVDNPFFRRPAKPSGNTSLPHQLRTFSTVRKRQFFVEVFYADSVHLDKLILKYGKERVFFSKTGIIGRGHSTRGGLRKNPSCGMCNPSQGSIRVDLNPYLRTVVNYGTMNSGLDHPHKPTSRQQPQIRSFENNRPRTHSYPSSTLPSSTINTRIENDRSRFPSYTSSTLPSSTINTRIENDRSRIPSYASSTSPSSTINTRIENNRSRTHSYASCTLPSSTINTRIENDRSRIPSYTSSISPSSTINTRIENDRSRIPSYASSTSPSSTINTRLLVQERNTPNYRTPGSHDSAQQHWNSTYAYKQKVSHEQESNKCCCIIL